MRLSIAFAALVAGFAMLSTAPSVTGPAQAKPSGAFAKLNGAWRGSGRIKLADGNSERISCRAYYTVKNSGAGLGFAFRCASPGNKIELRARIQDNNGRISGTWEERTFNATGQVTGRAAPNSIRMTIKGSVSGRVTIDFSNSSQKVSISTGTQSLRGIAINLRR